MKTLKEIHAEINYAGLQNLKKHISKKYKGSYTQKEIEDFYKTSEINQTTFKYKKRTKFNKILPIRRDFNGIPQPVHSGKIIYIDTTFIKYTKPNQMAIIVAIDLYSKKVWLKVIRLKKIPNDTRYSGVKSKDTLAFMKNIIQENKVEPIEIISDKGLEMLGEFNKEFKDIHRIFLENQKLLLTPIERANRTIKELWVNYYETNPKDKNYEEIFKKIADIYNNRAHSGIINLSPNEAHKNPIELDTYYMEMLKASQKVKNFPLEIGTKIRLYKPIKNSFDKLRSQWSKKIYTIEEENINYILKKYTNFDGSTRLYDVDEVRVVQTNENNVNESAEEEEETNQRPIRFNRNQRPLRYNEFV